MSKTKFALGMSMVVALFAFTATPALARFTNHGGKGAGKSGEITFTYEGGAVKCSNATGKYTVSSEGTAITVEEEIIKECKALGLEATVTCPSAEGKQPEKEGTETGKAINSQISNACVVKVAGVCEITIPTEGNQELKTVSLKKSGTNVRADSELTGITATAKGSGCALGGLAKEKTTSAKLKGPSEVAEGVGLE